MADDTFIVRTYKAPGKRPFATIRGRRADLFRSLVEFIDEVDGWRITSAALEAELQSAAKRRDVFMGITDMDHEFLAVSSTKGSLRADFYAARFYGNEFPRLRRIKAFADICDRIGSETTARNRGDSKRP